ncbi:ATP-binding protein [Paractinoplanes ferrugineus]|uniref:histidine kinase n=1 Tax=Paractinoplanes ferrugineus TaxID=113564 RepID=A0A919J9K9_9ACTN|nr:HAMP domain-containing sensor histidine kinase [Actinoplanes ferrugineus]GIE16673.1 two-component sensor histidine kinase [Actinoplanes ferrugineus]
MSRTVPLRHSLVTRLLITSVLIAIAAIAATAWLATRTATQAISQERGRSLTEDKGVYDMLVAYAAAHPDWSGAPALIQARAAKLGRRITLTTEDRLVLADSDPAGPQLRAARPSAVVDPLNLDLGLTGGSERIDPRAVGPFLVPPAERSALRKAAADVLDCLRGYRLDGRIDTRPDGRPAVTVITPDPNGDAPRCSPGTGGTIAPTQAAALAKLGRMTAACLGLQDNLLLQIDPDFQSFLPKGPMTQKVTEPAARVFRPGDPQGSARIRTCLERSRKTTLQPYVAPPALLFVTDPRVGADQTRFTLSGANTVRIITVTGAVLLATIVVTVLVGRRLVRPLRVLTEAADGHTPAAVSSQDEIGRLARALNNSAERRDRAEAQRRAMVSDVAHELRTPLSNIRSWLEAAQDNLAPTDGQLLALLHEESVLLQHIIDDLSDLAAADAGTLRIHPEPSWLRDVLAHVVESHRGTAHAAGIALTSQVDGDPVLTADPVRLRQLVGNLVANGIRYTPPGGSVTVGATAGTIWVRDTGVGIAPEHLPRIFDRFWRADESRSRSTGGSGLGLAIARKLAEAHGATIGVTSRPGHGTTFTVAFPAPS